ncbi:GH-E family nuclease [Avibacterium paragallinarum]|uniref:GH-E family nuclease n=1 Tax=Avibacterium paragallinarum TaxID=728 RepID=UPI002EDA963F
MLNTNNDYTKLENGDYYHTASDTTIKGPIDIGHIYGWEHRRLSLAAKELKMTQKEFNDYINAKADKFRLENRFDNRSHKNEMPGNGGLEDIKQDMKQFLNNK